MAAQSNVESTIISADVLAIPVQLRSGRLDSLDLLRGLLMILMALDHTRAYFSSAAVDPIDPLHSWPALFLTRWVTHLCAPGFIALAGASVYLQRQRGKTVPQLCRLLVTRGAWLVFLEITVISLGWSFTFPAPFLQVIWAIGIAMIFLALLLPLPARAIGALGPPSSCCTISSIPSKPRASITLQTCGSCCIRPASFSIVASRLGSNCTPSSRGLE